MEKTILNRFFSWEHIKRYRGLFTWGLAAVAVLILLLRFPVGMRVEHEGVPGDFAVVAKAWQRVAEGVTPYVVQESSPYKYSPGILTVMSVFPKDLNQAWFLFGLLNVFLFAGVLVYTLLDKKRWREPWAPVLLFLGLLLSAKGLIETLQTGQFELILLASAVLATALIRHVPWASGFILGVLPWLKLPWGILILPFFWAVRLRGVGLWRLLAGWGFALVVMGVGLPVAVFGVDRTLLLSQQWFALLKAQPLSLFVNERNQSLWFSLDRWLQSRQLGYLLLAAFAMVSLAWAIRLMRLKARALADQWLDNALAWITPWMIVLLLVNPLSWRWGSVLLLGVPWAAVRSARPVFTNWILWLATALLWFLQQNVVVNLLGYAHWTNLSAYGWVTAYWLVMLLLVL